MNIRYTRICIMLFLLLIYCVIPIQVIAEESDDYILGDAWSADQEMDHEESMVISAQNEEEQIFRMSGIVYYQKAYEALIFVNQERAKEGLSPLAMDEELTEAAMLRAAECSVFYSHTRPNGLACSSVSPKVYAENIAASTGMKFSTADAVVAAWMNSAGHRQNIMNQNYQAVGIGCFYKDGVWYWAQEFGRQQADLAVQKADGNRTYPVQALQRYTTPFFVVEHYNMEKGQQIQYQIRLYNMGWASASGYIDQDSYQWSSSNLQIAVNQVGVVSADGWGDGTITAVNLGSSECSLTGTVDVHTDAVIESVGEIYIQQSNREGLVAGLPLNLSKATDVEYSWYIATEDNGWTCIEDWTENDEWIFWRPEHYGDYTVAVQARVTGNPESTAMKMIPFSYHPQIVGKCQMPYTGEGGGYLIGIESYENPEQKYQYEMLVLDCTLLAEGKEAWIYSTGRCRVEEGNALWTIWQPQYGYYWTLFRVYNEQGTLIDEECYGFQNI